jgi:DNA mismatch repair protein MutL
MTDDTADSATVHELPTATVERIAAGEVITRPARVVAELVENALDADASRIEIRVDGDGTERIVVSDDGHGLSRADAERAVEPHTTSKIRDADDLQTADTLGFRGEALASIADAAAELELVTRHETSEPTATRVVVREDTADREKLVEDAGRARGTTVTVRGLFADRRARRESLASPAREFGRISTLVGRYALVHDDVAFTVTHDGREVLSTPGTGITDALLAVYDRETASRSTGFESALAVPELDTEVTITGQLVYPSVTRSDRSHVHVAVNGRPVRNAALHQSVARGYGTLLSNGAEPIAVVNLSLPATAIDVNVHPAKERVALRAGDAVAAAVEDSVSDALTTADLRRSGEVAMDLESSLAPVEGADSAFADATVIGQYRELYVLCEADEELLVIDQHAAHERVNFERLRAAVAESSVPARELDPPETLSLDPATAAAVADNAEALREVGFDVEPFGGTTYRVRSVPAPLGRAADPDAVRETAMALARGDDGDERVELLADLACHPSLKAGDELDTETATALVERLGECEQPYACPHGRPTVLSLDEATLASGFERGQTRRS